MEIKTIYFVAIAVLIIASFSSCIQSNEEFERVEAAKIQQYLADNPSLNFELKASGLYYFEVKTGTGLPATSHDTA